MIRPFLLACALCIACAACGGISEEKYIAVMTELGCSLVRENTPGAEKIYAQHGVTQAQIDAFRKSGGTAMQRAASDIAKKVAACHKIEY